MPSALVWSFNEHRKYRERTRIVLSAVRRHAVHANRQGVLGMALTEGSTNGRSFSCTVRGFWVLA